MKNIVVICDSFKGCMSSLDLGLVIRNTTQQLDPEIQVTVCSVSDGGEGLIESVLSTGHFLSHSSIACDPCFKEHKALWASWGKEAVIEMAQCSGLSLCEPRDPLKTSTYGTGLQILDALNHGCSTIYLGLGGSGTHDCGCGIACALGVKFYHQDKEFIPTGGTLDQIDRIDVSPLPDPVRNMNLICCCDVENPICGPQGAAYIFAAQKGASKDQILTLERNTCHLMELAEKQLQCSLNGKPGLGAAGACGLMLDSVFHCQFVSGLDKMLQWIRPEPLFLNADLVITGEGRIDEQSLHGKVPFGVLKLAQKTETPLLAVCGQLAIEKEKLKQCGFCDVLVLKEENMSTQESIERAPELLKKKWTQWLTERKEESL